MATAKVQRVREAPAPTPGPAPTPAPASTPAAWHSRMSLPPSVTVAAADLSPPGSPESIDETAPRQVVPLTAMLTATQKRPADHMELDAALPVKQAPAKRPAVDSVWPACGYQEFPYLKPGKVRRLGVVIRHTLDSEVAMQSPLWRAPDRLLGARMRTKANDETGYSFALYRDAEALVQRVYQCPPQQRHFCVTVEANQPVRFYVDLEFEMHGEERTTPERAAQLLHSTIEAVALFVAQQYGAGVAERWRAGLWCYTATVPRKYSFHGHSTGVAFESVEEEKRFSELLKVALGRALSDANDPLHAHALVLSRPPVDKGKGTSTKVHAGVEWFFDWGVFHDRRNFRLAFNSKPGKNNVLQRVTLERDENDQPRLHVHPVPSDYETFRHELWPSLIVQPSPSTSVLPPLPRSVVPEEASDNRSRNRNRGGSGEAHAHTRSHTHSPFADPPAEVLEALLEMVRHPSTAVTGGWEGFCDPYFAGVSKKSPTLLEFNYETHNQECPFGRQHDRRGFWLYVHPHTREVKLGCFGGACHDQQLLLGALPAEVSLPEAEDTLSGAARTLLENRFCELFQKAPAAMRRRRASADDNSGGEVELTALVEGNGQCRLRQQQHSDQFEDRLVVSRDGLARWECSVCAGERDGQRVKFLRTREERQHVFPERRVGSSGTDDPALVAQMQALNERYAVVQYNNGQVRVMDLLFRNPETGDHYPRAQSVDQFLQFRCNVLYTPAQGKPVSVAAAWLRWPERRSYPAVAFDPSERCGPGVLNFWQGFTRQPRAGDCAMELEARRLLVCDGNQEAYEYFLNLEAMIVQKPGEPLGMGVVFLGRQGVGKSVIAGQMGSLFGSAYCRIAHQRQLTNNFNHWQAGCCVAFVDEACWPGDKSAEGVLKSLLTDRDQMAEPKGADAYKMRNRVKLYFASNERYVVPAALDDRRWAVFRFSDTRRRDVAYFATLQRHWDDGGGAEAYLHFLLSRDLNGFNPLERPALCMAQLWSQKREHMRDHQAWWYEKLCNGRYAPCRTVQILFDPAKGGAPLQASWWPARVCLEDLYASYCEFYGRRRRSNQHSMIQGPIELWRTLKSELLPTDFSFSEHRLRLHGGGRVHVYDIPSLDACRIYFAQQVACAPHDVVFETVADTELDDVDE